MREITRWRHCHDELKLLGGDVRAQGFEDERFLAQRLRSCRRHWVEAFEDPANLVDGAILSILVEALRERVIERDETDKCLS